MPHTLILGMTESGKTALAKKLAEKYKEAGINVIVLDPLTDPSWNADYQTSDPDEFLQVFWQSRKCAVFIDEAGESAGRYDNAMIKTATKGRHWGHNVHYISQRGSMISPTIRGQCSKLFLFNTGLKDAKVHAEEWGKEELKNANQLKRGEFYHCDKFDLITLNKLF